MGPANLNRSISEALSGIDKNEISRLFISLSVSVFWEESDTAVVVFGSAAAEVVVASPIVGVTLSSSNCFVFHSLVVFRTFRNKIEQDVTVANAVAIAAPWIPYRGDKAKSPSILTMDAAATAIAGVTTSRVVKQNYSLNGKIRQSQRNP